MLYHHDVGALLGSQPYWEIEACISFPAFLGARRTLEETVMVIELQGREEGFISHSWTQ